MWANQNASTSATFGFGQVRITFTNVMPANPHAGHPVLAYRLFGLPCCAPAEKVRREYRRLAKRIHPDVGGDPEAMKELNAALDYLKKAGLA